MKRYIVSILILIFCLFNSIVFASGDRVSLGYIYNSSKSHTEIINSTNGNINTVSPTCFDLTNEGHLFINNIFDQQFVNDMHEQNVLVTPFLSNHWGRQKGQAALDNADILADEVVNAINEYNLDGVNVDLENLLPRDKDNLTNFVRILREKLPEDKILSVAVAANPKKLTKTWVATYDYENLAKYADYLVLMAYDEHSAGGSEGPVASIGFVEQSVQVMLETVSRDKIVLGIPLYGRFWQENAETGGEAIISAQVERIASRYKESIPVYDEMTGTATLTIEVKADERKAYVNGRYLEEGIYTIWYENEDCILRKLEVMNKYGLKGAGLWAVGNENDDFWNYYSKGFKDDKYESEESIEKRAYYAEVEMLMKEVEPLRLTHDLNFEKEVNVKETKVLKSDMKYLIKRKYNLKKIYEVNEKVFEKKKHLKNLKRISFTHIIKRYSNENC